MSIKYFLDLSTFCLDVDCKDWQNYNRIRLELQYNLPVLLRIPKEMVSKVLSKLIRMNKENGYQKIFDLFI